MIRSILVANRGEIAARVIRSANRLGIKAVALYSDADRNGCYMREAAETVSLGGKTPLESYLDAEKIIAAALFKKCDAVHPGYGFLSENPAFAERCAQAGLIFIGPEAASIRLMGDKARARQTAQKLGLPTVPGSGVVEGLEEAQAVCARLGYPVLLKASAGGGGIGMRKVEDPAGLAQAYSETADRAGAAFGDNRIFVEKYLNEPHHVEIQVLRDRHGGAITFPERECSVQRRYQKVIEESPSTCVSAALRRALREAARRLAEGIGYVNAATVEFVVDKERRYYFLEANTRLQVEHPLTEALTGLDLVELQIRIADGEKLPLDEAELEVRGWALEARIYAEDPRRFYPSPGTITEYAEPSGEGVRVDSGYGPQGVVTPYYDPLVAKLITWGAGREEALHRMLAALDAYYIAGIRTNIPFLKEAFASPLFRDGGYDTHFVEKLRLLSPPSP
ncbi:MAG: biotin carboxylase N-terminal domain-containing protein [Bacillota bacterium]